MNNFMVRSWSSRVNVHERNVTTDRSGYDYKQQCLRHCYSSPACAKPVAPPCGMGETLSDFKLHYREGIGQGNTFTPIFLMDRRSI